MIDDLQIAAGLKRGDEDAFHQLYSKFAVRLNYHLRKMVGNNEVAEEILHDVFMMIVKKISFFKGDSGNFKAWIFRIATNMAIDHIRREKRKYKMMEGEQLLAIRKQENDIDTLEISDTVDHMMQKLSLSQRTIFNLKIQEGLSCMEISRVCGCSLNAVKQTLFKARRSLKKRLAILEELL